MSNDLADDWRDETQTRLSKSEIYTRLKEKCKTDPPGQQVLALIDDASYYAFERTKLIVKHMAEFTLHDGDHLFRVLNLMERILTKDLIEELSVPELMLLILTAFFHDIGMAPSEHEVRAWMKDWASDEPTPWEIEEAAKFSRFCEARPDRQEEIQRLHLDGNHSKAQVIEKYLISEYIRTTHAERAKKIIAEDWNGKIKYRDLDITNEFAALCFSHNQDALSLLEMDKSLPCGNEKYACLPFVGVVLRLADILDFDAKRTPTVLFSHLGVRNAVSLKEWMKHRAINSWIINSNKILFQAKCDHPAIEASIRQFCDDIDKELIACNSVLDNLSDQIRIPFPTYYKLKLPPKVDRSKIGPKLDIYGDPVYQYRDTQFTLSKTQVIELLMGTRLYGNPEVALRELLQNSIDACLFRQASEESWENQYTPKIVVEFIEENNNQMLRVIDNGMGMDQYIIDNYYAKVGSSFYKSTDFYDLKSQTNMIFTPTSRFGIGILSCFMVSDSLQVDTRRLYGPHDSSNPIQVIVEGHDSIFWIRPGSRKLPGTTTELLLRKDNPWHYMTDEKKIDFVRKTVPNPPFPIEIIVNSKKIIHNSSGFLNLNNQSISAGWEEHNNVKKLKLNITDAKCGISGTATVGILEKNGKPIREINLFSKDVSIEGIEDYYTLNTLIKMSNNKISKTADTLEINEDEEVHTSSTSSEIAKSKSEFSLHGIEIPMELFPDSWLYRNQLTRLVWPFPVILRVDINGTRDIDLNSARTQVAFNEKWTDFAETLAFIVCREIHHKVSEEYWKTLIDIWQSLSKDKTFLEGLNRAICEKKATATHHLTTG